MRQKILYMALSNIDNDFDGVAKKIKGQVKALMDLEFDVDIFSYGNDGIYLYTINKSSKISNYRLIHRFDFFVSLKKHLKNHTYDYFYLRYPRIDYLFYSLLKKIRKQKCEVFIEIASYPIPKQPFCLKGILRECIYLQEKFLFPKLKNLVDKFILIGEHEDMLLGVPTINISNGIDLSYFPMKKQVIHKQKEILTIITVSNMYKTHGYDRLLKSLGTYYLDKKRHHINIKIIMVGNGECLQEYKNICKSFHIEDRVIFTGKKAGDDLNHLFDEADLAVGALAVFRENFFSASTLKVKEYISRGIPFIYAAPDPALPKDFPFALEFPNDDSEMYMEDVIDFYYSKCNFENTNVQIRKYAEKMSWKYIMQKVFKRNGDVKCI